MKEMEMRTVGTEGRTVKKRKVLLDACLAGGTRAHWDGRDLMTLAEGRCEWRARYVFCLLLLFCCFCCYWCCYCEG